MQTVRHSPLRPLLLLAAGAKGAIGSTLAVAAAALEKDPEKILPFLTTGTDDFSPPGAEKIVFAGWDVSSRTLEESIEYHRVLSREIWSLYRDALSRVLIQPAPASGIPLSARVEKIAGDIRDLQHLYPGARPVLVNLLPASAAIDRQERSLDQLYSNGADLPDLAYALAAISCGAPVINFTPNEIEMPAVVNEAMKAGVPLCGRDGKTGQTYLKVVLASALKARSLRVEGWYSLNILGNEDGRNLADPKRAAGKLANKTEVLERVLGYPVGDGNGAPAHKVVIDYYPLRGDAKEAWDVIDFSGLFGLPMSLRLNLLARDSILAAPMVIDLARWMAALHSAGHSGLVPELGFFFKKPLGSHSAVSFQDQLAQLARLKSQCMDRI